MAPEKESLRPETPGSLKVLIIIETFAALFLGFWIYSEYVSNLYFQSYANAYLQYLATYVPMLGLSIGVAGLTAVALILRGLRQTKPQVKTDVRSGTKETESSPPDSPLNQGHTSMSHTVSPGMPIKLEGGPVQVGLTNDGKEK